MVFDAGAVSASLTVDTSQFNRDLDAAEARVKRLEDAKHEVKLSAVFDSSSLSRARQQFAQLDNQISKDAMSRLRSNPQGSVLGALNALFSPHPVTGAPSAAQAAQQGLLGKIISAPGGGGTAGPVDTRAQSSAVSRVLGTAVPSGGTVTERVNVIGAPKDTTTTDRVNVVGGAKDNSITTTDRVNTVGLPTNNAITTQDRVNVTGLPTTGGTITTEDKIEPQVDEASLKAKASQAGKDAADAADDSMTKESRSRGSGWFSGFLSGVPAMVGKLFSGGGNGGAGTPKVPSPGSSGSFGGNLVNGIGPGILGTSFKTASIAGLLGAGIGGIPALVAGTAPLAVGAAGAGVLALGAKTLIGSKNTKANPNAEGPLYAQAQAAGKALQGMVQTAASGLVTPLKNLFAQVPALAKQVTPALTAVFSGAAALIQPVVAGLVSAVKQIGPGLGAAFRAAGPLLQPLITGLGSLVGGLLPGLVSLLHAAAPAVSVVSGFFASLGSNLGTMFRQFSTVIGPSSTILKALLDVVTGLLPVIGGLAQVMAAALGPAFTAFAGTIRALEPFLVGIGKIFAQFAGAVLTDLSAGLQLVAHVLTAVAPAFNVLAASLGQVFSTLESKGGFAQLGNVLEGIAAPLGNLITSLVRGLAPAIPPILTLFSDLVNVISTVGVQVLTALIPPIANLAGIALGALERVLPAVIPLVTQFLTAFTADAGRILTQVGGALLNLATVVLVKLLQAAEPLIPVVLSLLNAFTPLLNILTPVVATTITAIADALAAVAGAIPAPAITAVAVGVAAVVGGMKLWDLAITGVLKGMYLLDAVTGSTLVASLAGAVSGIRDFMTATEGATLAQRGLLAAELAADALNPFGWIALGVVGIAALVLAFTSVNNQAQQITRTLAQQDQATGYNISGYQKLAAQLDTLGASYSRAGEQTRSFANAARGGGNDFAEVGQQLSAQSQAVVTLATNMQTRLSALSAGLGVSKTTIEQWASAAGISAEKFAGAGENVGKLTQQVIDFVNKNAEGVTAASSLGQNIAIFGNDVFSATTQLDAFNAIWNTLVGNLLTKQQAITQGQQSFDNLKQSIASSGAASTQSQQSFQAYIQQIQSSLDALQKGGASVSDLNGYLQAQIDHLGTLGPLNKGEQADLANLKAFQDALANSAHGLTDNQLTWISQMEGHLIPDLDRMHANTPLVNTDISNLANAIAQTGTNSAATASDRATLIADISKITGNTQAATKQVDDWIAAFSKVPKSVSTSVTVSASAKGAITAALGGTNTSSISNIEAQLQFGAAGMLVSGGTPGKDSVLAMLMPGEVVVPKAMVQGGAVDHLRGSIPGFAAGGMVNLAAPYQFVNTDDGNFVTDMGQYFMSQANAAFQASAKAAAAAAGTPVAYSKVAGITQWEPDVARVLSMLGLPQSDLPTVMSQMGTESGGNPNAINLTDSNAAAGDPSKGLMQVISGTFAAYRNPSLSSNIYDPLANIYAGVNYAVHRYGNPGWLSVLGHGHGYANGGMITEPVLGTGLRSGDRYVLGERGSEMVTPIGGARGSMSVSDLADRLDQLHADMREMVTATRQVPAGVGQHVGGAINGAAHDASFRSRYPRGGA